MSVMSLITVREAVVVAVQAISRYFLSVAVNP